MYKIGAKDEDPERTGFAHLFEHLMFEGSKNSDTYDEPLQEAGGENNAFTNNDYTNYYCQVPKNNLDVALFLEADRMCNLKINQRALNEQKKVVIEEFKEELKLWPKNQTKRSKLENIAKLISKDQKFGKDGFKRSLLTSQIIKKSINRIKIQVNNDLPPCLWKVDYEKKEARFLVYLLKKLNYYIQIDSNKLKIIEDRGKEIVKNIFNKIIDLKGKILPSDYRIKFELFLNEAQYFIELAEKYRTNEEEYMNYYNQAKQCQYRIVCDFIASMTDDYAVRFYNRLHSDHPDTIYRNVD